MSHRLASVPCCTRCLCGAARHSHKHGQACTCRYNGRKCTVIAYEDWPHKSQPGAIMVDPVFPQKKVPDRKQFIAFKPACLRFYQRVLVRPEDENPKNLAQVCTDGNSIAHTHTHARTHARTRTHTHTHTHTRARGHILFNNLFLSAAFSGTSHSLRPNLCSWPSTPDRLFACTCWPFGKGR